MEWITAHAPIAYPDALEQMEARVEAIRNGSKPEMVWLLEHPPLYTAGTASKPEDLIESRFPVFAAGRGGKHTYHGPGQRVGYVMLDLKKRGSDIHLFVRMLEQWLIATLAHFGLEGFTRDGRTGVWVSVAGGEAKIAAIGIRIRSWVSYHGISLNVDPDLTHFSGIVPCGIREFGVTSLRALGISATMQEVDDALKQSFETIFSARADAA